jgi:hypothetical protein
MGCRFLRGALMEDFVPGALDIMMHRRIVNVHTTAHGSASRCQHLGVKEAACMRDPALRILYVSRFPKRKM